MRHLVFLGPGRLEWQETESPELGSDLAALVRPLAVASCDLDRALVGGLLPFQPPFAVGHECIAEVEEVGDAVVGVRPGDRVAVAFQVSCGECRYCRLSLSSNCNAVPRESMFGIGQAGGGWGGAIASLLRVPYADAMLVPLPSGVDAVAAASAPDNVADAYRAVAPGLTERSGGPVLVLNGGPAGSTGLYAVQIALALGAEAVDYVDRSPTRLEHAARLGASVRSLGEWPRRLGPYPVVVDNGIEQEAIACALRSTEPGGFCTSTSMYFQKELKVPIMEMYSKGVTFRTGRVESRALLPAVLDLIHSEAIEPQDVVTEEASFDEAPEALLGYSTKLVLTAADL